MGFLRGAFALRGAHGAAGAESRGAELLTPPGDGLVLMGPKLIHTSSPDFKPPPPAPDPHADPRLVALTPDERAVFKAVQAGACKLTIRAVYGAFPSGQHPHPARSARLARFRRAGSVCDRCDRRCDRCDRPCDQCDQCDRNSKTKLPINRRFFGHARRWNLKFFSGEHTTSTTAKIPPDPAPTPQPSTPPRPERPVPSAVRVRVKVSQFTTTWSIETCSRRHPPNEFGV